MNLIEQIQKDITAAMKTREEQRLSTLRMVKSALKNKEIEKMAPLDDKESQQVLSTLIKQRKDSVEQFTKGGRQEMADKEAAEIKLIETYLPKAAGEEEIVAGVRAAIAEMTPAPAMKDMGMVMKAAMARFAAAGMRVDGKVVSEAVKKEWRGNEHFAQNRVLCFRSKRNLLARRYSSTSSKASQRRSSCSATEPVVFEPANGSITRLFACVSSLMKKLGKAAGKRAG